jgi:hypothetical protein
VTYITASTNDAPGKMPTYTSSRRVSGEWSHNPEQDGVSLPPPEVLLRIPFLPHQPQPNPSGALSVGCGCAMLAPSLCMVAWQSKFHPHQLEKYDRFVNPIVFLQIYTTATLATGRNKTVIENYFLVASTGSAQSWLMNLPRESIHSCGEHCR